MFIKEERIKNIEGSIKNIEGFIEEAVPMVKDYHFKLEAKKRFRDKVTGISKVLGMISVSVGLLLALFKYVV